jgi:hypothetical protein
MKIQPVIFTSLLTVMFSFGFSIDTARSNSPTSPNCPNKSSDSNSIALTAGKRCEFAMETKAPNATDKTVKTCSYKCKGYGALANFSWPINQPCPPSFETNFPGP